jgi:hypothetical protein
MLMKNIIVCDNFYENPDSIRNIAIESFKKTIDEKLLYYNWNFIEFKGYYDDMPGLSKQNKTIIGKAFETFSFYSKVYQDKIEELLKSKIQYTCENNGIFILNNCLTNPISVNINNNINNNTHIEEWIGIVFLTPKAPFEGGITIKQNKNLKSNSLKSIKNLEKSIQMVILDNLKKECKDTSFWETDCIIANLYNRLVLFKKDYFYSSSMNFGIKLEDSRLVHFFSFGIYKY